MLCNDVAPFIVRRADNPESLKSADSSSSRCARRPVRGVPRRARDAARRLGCAAVWSGGSALATVRGSPGRSAGRGVRVVRDRRLADMDAPPGAGGCGACHRHLPGARSLNAHPDDGRRVDARRDRGIGRIAAVGVRRQCGVANGNHADRRVPGERRGGRLCPITACASGFPFRACGVLRRRRRRRAARPVHRPSRVPQSVRRACPSSGPDGLRSRWTWAGGRTRRIASRPTAASARRPSRERPQSDGRATDQDRRSADGPPRAWRPCSAKCGKGSRASRTACATRSANC